MERTASNDTDRTLTSIAIINCVPWAKPKTSVFMYMPNHLGLGLPWTSNVGEHGVDAAVEGDAPLLHEPRHPPRVTARVVRLKEERDG